MIDFEDLEKQELHMGCPCRDAVPGLPESHDVGPADACCDGPSSIAPQVMATKLGRFFYDPPQDFILECLRHAGTWEDHVAACAANLFATSARNSAFIDCGAHIGIHSIAAAYCNGCCNVLAVEMMLHTFHLLQRNIELNASITSKVTAVRAFLSNVTGKSALVSDNAACGNNTGMARVVFDFDTSMSDDGDFNLQPCGYRFDKEVASPKLCDMQSQMLDDIIEATLASDARIGLVKVDVEGHELSVLQGAARTLKRWQPALLVEIWDDSEARAHGTSANQSAIVQAIEQLGFVSHRLMQGACEFLFLPIAL